MATAVVIPVAGRAGVVEQHIGGSGGVALPSWPHALSPQQLTRPSWRRPHVCSALAARATGTKPGTVVGVTVVGVEDEARLPLPSRPSSLRPQHRAVPSRRTAHVWKMPASMESPGVIPLTVTGVDEMWMAGGLIVAPSPSWP